MPTRTVNVHGDGATGTRPNISAVVTTTHTGWSGVTPLYTVTITLNGLGGYSYFGYNLYIHLNGESKQIKGNSPSQWSAGVYSVSFSNVPKGSNMRISSTNCGCNSWNPSAQPDYGSTEATGVGIPGSQLVNGKTTVEVLERTESLKLTWGASSGGTFGVKGYRIYYSRGVGWTKIAEVDANTREYTTSIAACYNALTRGDGIGFQITAFNDYFESAYKNGKYDNNKVLLKAMSMALSKSNITPIQAKINWSSNIAVQKVEWKLSSENTWRLVSSSLNTTSGSFNATGLKYNTTHTVQVRLTAKSDSTQLSSSVSVKTLDIARIAKYPAEWSVEDSAELTIINPGGCTLQLYLSYNNVEVISRSNITLTNDKYVLTLNDSEKNLLYTKASSDNNPSFKFVLKSYISNKIGEDSKSTKVTFPTKAWVKINNTWKRALVWGKVNSTWKQCIPWVKVGSNWKRI